MKISRIIGVVFALAAGTTQAQQLPVRSGDHTSFSRLTLPIAASQSWEAKFIDDGIVITLADFSKGFDLEGVFLRMQRNRITSIDTKKNSLTLSLGCTCIATAFRSGPLLVIDVADAGTQLAAPALEAFKTRKKLPKTAGNNVTASTTIALPWIGRNSPFGAVTSPNSLRSSPRTEMRESNALKDRVRLLSETQKTLTENVANAANTGLLEPNPRMPLTPRSQLESGDEKTPPTNPKNLPEIITTASQNMRVTSSMDLRTQPASTQFPEAIAGLSCPQKDILAVDTWGEGSAFSAQVGPARSALVNARDQLDKDAAKRLAQLYIYFGFGAEAKNALRLAPELAVDQAHILAVATILEEGAIIGQNTLGKFANCPSDIALWASLSFVQVPSDTSIDTNATLRALNKLPRHLRRILAPALSDRLLQYGDAPAATAAMRSIERLPEPLSNDAIMAQAELALDAGKPAEAFLEEVIKANAAQSPEALAKLVESKLARDEPLSLETANLVEAYVQELRGTAIGGRLLKTQIIALSQSLQFTKAFDALEALAPTLSPQAHARLRTTVLEQLYKTAEDVGFLEHVFAQNREHVSELTSKTKLLLASRMMDLGFGAQVQMLLDSVPDRPRTPERQLLAARAALALQQPFQAQAALIGIIDPQADLLLAKAKEMSGLFREASEIYANNKAPEQAAQAAWLSEDWRDLISPESPQFGPALALDQNHKSSDDQALGPLGRADQAIEESRAARDTLEQLLNDPEIQVTPKS